MTRVTFSLCEDCLLEFFKTFKIEPQYSEYGAFAGDALAEELETAEENGDKDA
jgi:hypothetical protein